MATFTNKLSGNSAYTLTLTVTERANSIDISNNTSIVDWVLSCTKASGTGYWSNNANAVTCTINGNKVLDDDITFDFRGSTPKTITLGSGSLTITHDSDGSKSISVSGSFSTTVIGSATVSGMVDLSEIPRASSISKVSGDYLGSAITVNISRYSSAYTHTIQYSFEDSEWTTGKTGVTTSGSFTPPLSLGALIPNATQGVLQIKVITYNGDTYVGEVTTSKTINLPSTAIPSKPSISIVRVDNGVPSSWGVYVKNYSKVTVNASASGSYGSTIRSYSITVDSMSGSNGDTFGPFSSSGEKTVTVVVTDSRGRTNSNTAKFTVYDYFAPSISIRSAQRCTSDGTVSPSGTYIKVVCDFDYADVNGKNTISRSVSCNGKSNSTFSSGTAFVLAANCSLTNTYTLTASITDGMGKTQPATAIIPTDVVPMSVKLNKKGIGIGKFAENDNTLDVAWDLRLRNGMSVDNPNLIPFLYREPWWNDGSGQNVDDDISGIHFAYPSHGTPGYGTVATFSCFGKNDWAYPFQLQGCYTNNRLYYRSKYRNNGWKAWSEIAFVGDAISNANGASLANAYIPNNSNLMGVRSDGTKRRFLTMLSNNQMYFCQDGDDAYFGGDIYGQKNKLVAYDGNVVHDSGNESISGVKTFTGGIVIPNFNASSLQSTSGYRAIATPVAQPFIDYMKPTDNGSSKYLHVQISGWGSYGINMWASDRELKKDIADSTVTAIETINKIKHRAFKWKENDIENKNGYIAQELEEINPDFVLKIPQTEDNKFSYQINETIIIPYITKAIQELCTIIENQQKEIELLKEALNIQNA